VVRRRRGFQPPGGFPERPVDTATGADPFERLVEEALDGLPDWVHRALENVAVVIEDEPSPEQRATAELLPGETLYGLYEGTPAVEWGADSVPFPNKISLFRWPLEDDFADPRELSAEVRRTVLHELAHHIGMDEARLHKLGLD
jgi:predicted Zn-dependent protease with MMP-like domain